MEEEERISIFFFFFGPIRLDFCVVQAYNHMGFPEKHVFDKGCFHFISVLQRFLVALKRTVLA